MTSIVPSNDVMPWGRLPGTARGAIDLWWRGERLPDTAAETLPHGAGRSYGDCCIPPQGPAMRTRHLDRFIRFDRGAGVLWCEAGVTLDAILELARPAGWTLAVVPGTRHVTVGGAIANDVHGKNHHWAGTFGRHVRRFELLRSDGSRRICSPAENAEWFAATIAGLGLTGVVTWVELQLARLGGESLEVETTVFETLADFLALSERLERDGTFTAAWLDVFSYRRQRMRGLFSCGRMARGASAAAGRARTFALPPFVPNALAIPGAMPLFNRLYFARGRRPGPRAVDPASFQFPLDAVGGWNRLYGGRGFVQLQCVLPRADGIAGVEELLDHVAASAEPCYLAVLKRFGDAASPGVLSFPMPGITVALDFPNHGERTVAHLRRCHDIVMRHGGRIYPAKDTCMTAESFKRGFPRWEEVARLRDPRLTSRFWQRTAGA